MMLVGGNKMDSKLEKTIKDNKFADVFTEITCTGHIGVNANEELRLFRLSSVIDNHFEIEDLLKFLKNNIGLYVFNRSRIIRYHDEDEDYLVTLDALDVLRKKGVVDETGTGNELSELLLYVFLESVLGAPKIYSKVELKSSSFTNGVHLKILNPEGERIRYELVFGSSNITGDLGDAVEDAFDQIARINDHTCQEVQLVRESIFELPSDDPAIPAITEYIKPSPGKSIVRSTAFGIFLGYTVGLDKSRSDNDYLDSIENKIDDDINAYLPFIKKRISELGLEGHSFYFYILPFDDAEIDKRRIMSRVLGR